MSVELKLQEYLTGYKQEFAKKIWPDEKYKWEAVKCFQDNWKIDAEDFPARLKASLSKTGNLLQNTKLPKDMIEKLADAAPTEVRQMFYELFDESGDLYGRIDAFKNKAQELCNKYYPSKSHYQDENTISIYLWLKYPDKYYIYKQTLAKMDAEALQADYQFKRGNYAQNIKDFMLMYDEINEIVSKDEELIKLLKENLTEETCWPDTKFKTLTIDVSYYIWGKAKEKSKMKKDFYKNLGEDDSLSGYTKSYKLVLYKYLFELMDDDGVADFAVITEKFKNYYLDRKNRGLLPDKDVDSVIANIETSSNEDVYKLILKNPYNYIQDKGYITKAVFNDSEKLCLNEELVAVLDESDLEKIREIIDDKLNLYFRKIDDNITESESITEWIVPVNPDNGYKVEEAFKCHKILCWKQDRNFSVGDIAYIYESGTKSTIRFKCRINKVNMKTKEIDDSKYELKVFENTGRFYEIELLKELDGEEYKYENLKKHGFYAQPGPVRANTKLKQYLDSIENEGEVKMVEGKHDFSKNMILFGPPGTGKTYSTVLYAVAIIEGKTIEEIQNESYKNVLNRYNELKSQRHIEFITFHQSYGYEEFIEGIKPVMKDDVNNDSDTDDKTDDSTIQYKVMDGVFKDFCVHAEIPQKANGNEVKIKEFPKIWKVSLHGTGDNTVRRECLANGHIRIAWPSYGKEITTDTKERSLNAFVNKMQIGDVVLSCWSETSIDAIGVITGDYEWNDEYKEEYNDFYKRLRNVNWLVKGIDENIMDLNDGVRLTQACVYELNRISLSDVLTIVAKYKKNTELLANEKKYVFIIDEINRGNISKIFGELITLIEESKRLGEVEEMTARLPYRPNKPPFGVPNNVYIIGTMNTADRSIATIDTALRRRFKFIEMQPNIDKLKDVKVGDVSIGEMLDHMNKRITVLYDREHTIGHSYFMPLKINPDISVLADIFRNNIMPLLQEYFYDDYEKIALVLGDNQKKQEDYKFITVTNNNYKELFGNEDVELDESKSFTINDAAFSKIESYKGI